MRVSGFIWDISVYTRKCVRAHLENLELMMQSTPTPKVVLCVDDEEVIVSLLQSALSARGYVVVSAGDGTEALTKATTGTLDAVILDYGLPGADGGKVAAELRRFQPDTPIVLFSGSQEIPPNVSAIVDVVLPKSEGLGALLAVLQRLLRIPTGEPVAVRRTPRFPAHVPFTVTVDRSGELAMLCGVSFNFGEGGIGGKIEGELVPGEFVLLQIVDSRLARPLEPRAQVRYREDDTYGFKFYDVSPPEQAHVRQLCSRFASA